MRKLEFIDVQKLGQGHLTKWWCYFYLLLKLIFSDFCRAHEFRHCNLFYFIGICRPIFFRRIMCQILLSKDFHMKPALQKVFLSLSLVYLCDSDDCNYMFNATCMLDNFDIVPIKEGTYVLSTWICLSVTVILCYFQC